VTGDPLLHLVLVQPLIPPNTGSVGRLCVATGTRLHLVEPLGFDIDEKAVRRAGLDYWRDVDLHVHADWQACKDAIGGRPDRYHFLSSHGTLPYTAATYAPGDVLVFGKETTGLGAALREEAGDRLRTIPHFGPVRSLNLAVSAGIVLYEALRRLRPDALPAPPPASDPRP
jgi:tRNA (cytidine/uridine-2'-O-)-methyltransferase